MQLSAAALASRLKCRERDEREIQLNSLDRSSFVGVCEAGIGTAVYGNLAFVVVNAGTLLPFSGARCTNGGDVGEINLVVRHSSDGSIIWGSTIVVWAAGLRCMNIRSHVDISRHAAPVTTDGGS